MGLRMWVIPILTPLHNEGERIDLEVKNHKIYKILEITICNSALCKIIFYVNEILIYMILSHYFLVSYISSKM